MQQKPVRHLLGISGGKDSAALAIYMHQHYPELPIEYYCCDTGKELDETYQLIDALEIYLGKPIQRLRAAEGSHHEAPFDHFIEQYGGYLPSSNARWCTKNLKLEPFERFVGDDPVISYVGIRGDEDREGYISKKSNIQSIFPFRRNIWSEDVIAKALSNANMPKLEALYAARLDGPALDRALKIVRTPLSGRYAQAFKLEDLLEHSIRDFNHVVHAFLRETAYPLSQEPHFPLLDNEDNLVRDDIFRLLRESGVGVPAYYEALPFSVDGQTGHYARSRSGCYFCFYQQKIEWVWLMEQHPELYEMAAAYEKGGYLWNQDESLIDLRRPERVAAIKSDYLKRQQAKSARVKPNLVDLLLDDSDQDGCLSCFL